MYSGLITVLLDLMKQLLVVYGKMILLLQCQCTFLLHILFVSHFLGVICMFLLKIFSLPILVNDFCTYFCVIMTLAACALSMDFDERYATSLNYIMSNAWDYELIIKNWVG